MSFGAFGIFVPGGLFAGKSDDQDIVPGVFVEIEGVGEKVVGIGIFLAKGALKSFDGFLCSIRFLARERFGCRIIFMALFEVGSFVPVRPATMSGLRSLLKSPNVAPSHQNLSLN